VIEARPAQDDDAVVRARSILRPLGTRVAPGGSLGALTTYRVGGPAALLVTVADRAELVLVSQAQAESGLPVLVVGRGSNLLVADAGFRGIAVILDPGGFGEVIVLGTNVRAGAAVALPALARQTVEAGLAGFEWAVGVPGSVGGAVRMNAGGHGSDMAATLKQASVVDLDHGGEERTLTVGDLAYGYRRSSIASHQVVVQAELALRPGDREAGREAIREIVRWRREHQPGGQNAGSVFTNPPDDSAGRIIDLAGLKGFRSGSAMVSPKHANFIQADSGGSADDVYALMRMIRAKVRAAMGIDLAAEVRLIGFPEQPSSSTLDLDQETQGD
jgi:UDP-N-acetylmuramate dehydrogenase